MNISELFDLTQWISREIESTQVLGKYQNLQSIIQMHTHPGQPRHPFETEKNELIETLKNIPAEKLTKDHLSFLDKLEIAPYIGEEGIKEVEDVLYKNVIDVATSAQKLSEIIQKISNGLSKSNQIKAGLANCVSGEVYELNNEVLMRISFTGNAAMENVSDFKEWGAIWYDIGRGIAMAHNTSPENIKIVGATKGSIIIELAVIASIATTASAIILAALKVAEKVLDIRKKAEEIRGLRLKNDKLAADLEEAAENEKKEGVQEIANSVSLKLEIKSSGEGDKVKALEVAVKNLVNFIEKGGVVDFVMPEESNDKGNPTDTSELRIAFQEIRRLEKKLELLEYNGS